MGDSHQEQKTLSVERILSTTCEVSVLRTVVLGISVLRTVMFFVSINTKTNNWKKSEKLFSRTLTRVLIQQQSVTMVEEVSLSVICTSSQTGYTI